MDLLPDAKTVAERIEVQSAKATVPVAACIMGRHGNVVLMHRMSGTPSSRTSFRGARPQLPTQLTDVVRRAEAAAQSAAGSNGLARPEMGAMT